MSAKRSVTKKNPSAAVASPEMLRGEVRHLIVEARQGTAQAVNAGLTLLYWQGGDRIRREILKEKRAEYGAEILQTLSAKLEVEFGRGFAEKNLRRMVQFAEVFSDREIVVSLIRQLTWTHFIVLIPLKDPLQRDFYAEMCRIEKWGTRTLRDRIASMLYERTALSKRPKQLIEQELKALREEDRLTPDLIFRDPYVLDFLGLKDLYSEKDVENALLREIESFLLELGNGFAFVERQKRITLDGDDYYLDLLFYHRRLCRLIAVELKPESLHPRRYRTDGTLFTLVGPARTPERRRKTPRPNPLRRQEARNCRSARTGATRHSCRRIPDCIAPAGTAPEAPPRCTNPCPPTIIR